MNKESFMSKYNDFLINDIGSGLLPEVLLRQYSNVTGIDNSFPTSIVI